MLSTGRLVLEGKAADLLQDEGLRKAYLGGRLRTLLRQRSDDTVAEVLSATRQRFAIWDASSIGRIGVTAKRSHGVHGSIVRDSVAALSTSTSATPPVPSEKP